MEKEIEKFQSLNQESCDHASVEEWATWCEGEESWME